MRRKLLQFMMTDGNVVRMFHCEKLRKRGGDENFFK